MTSSGKGQWFVLAGLLALGVIPSLVGASRLAELTGGAEITPENSRFLAAPAPVVLHVLGAVPFALLGAVQITPAWRERHPARHRRMGRLLVPCGLLTALTGVWMAVSYPQPDGDGGLLTGFRLLFGSAMAAFIVLGFAAIRRRRVALHRAWMLRGYAIGIGAGTQTLLILPWVILLGPPGELSEALLHGVGWLINLAVAELAIRRP